MGFTAKQTQALRRGLSSRSIRTREANGRELSYIEGWYAISEANRIFGFDAWSRETMDSRCVLTRENRGAFLAVYIAKVRITVQADGTTIVREGHGSGEGRGTSPGEAHDTASRLRKPTPPSGRCRPSANRSDLSSIARIKMLPWRARQHSSPRQLKVRRPSRVTAHTQTTQRRSRGHRTTTVGATIAPWQTCSGRIRQKPKNALRQPLLRPPPQLNSLRPGSTRASSRLPNPNGCATRRT